MAVHSLYKIQYIPASIEDAWTFFSDPAKLPLITPPDMRFRVISSLHGDRVYAGQLIEYNLRPLPFYSAYWMTEITHVSEGHYFVDEQRFGPYSFWHHQHHFRELAGGLEMTDIVHYRVPLGWIGELVNSLVVRRRLEQLFEYRFRKVEEIFGAWTGDGE